MRLILPVGNPRQRWGAEKVLGAIAASMLLGSALALTANEAKPRFSAKRFEEAVRFLASEKMKGRGNGSPELEQAARYIARHFRRARLRPAGNNGTYMQRFTMTVGAKLGVNNTLVFPNGAARRSLVVRQEFIPFSFSEATQIEAPVVFAGYGITAPEFDYDDYRGIDPGGKIVVVFRHEPQENDERSVFAGRQYTTHAEIVSKAVNAKSHGASGMILVNDVGNHPGQEDELIAFGTLAGPAEMKLVALHVKASVVDEWLKPSGNSLDQLRQAIDKDLSSHSFELDPTFRLAVTVDVKRTQRKAANVVGILPGQDSERVRQCIVIGAHYDHLGLGQQHSLAPSQMGKVHHGADDNASGTSGLLQLADYFAQMKRQLNHTLVFAAFAGEETGLLGSSYYISHAACRPEQTVAMVNLDMIGRVSKNRIYVGGTGTSPDFRRLVEEANRAANFELSYSASGYGASDHMSFTVRSVPVLFFFSGLHADYHKPSDTWEKIDSVTGARVLELVTNVVSALDSLPEKPQFVRVAEPSPPAIGGGGGYGTYFGSIPDFGESERGGVKFADVRDGSPAAKAGFKGGDVLIEFDDKKIDNLYDFTYALRAHKPGDKVAVTVMREGERLTREVTLEKRQ